MGLQRSVGITVGISTTLPATHDSTGFAALTYTACGKLSAVPDMSGTYDVATFDDLSTGVEEKFADVLRAGAGELMFGFDPSDTGQSAIEGAQGGNAAFAFTLSDGTVYYRKAIVTSYTPTNIQVGGVVMSRVNLEFYDTAIKVAA